MQVRSRNGSHKTVKKNAERISEIHLLENFFLFYENLRQLTAHDMIIAFFATQMIF